MDETCKYNQNQIFLDENLNLNEVVLMIIGNKVDKEKERKVPTDRPISQYKNKFDIDCWEVSAKNGYNIKEIFIELTEKIYQMNLRLRGSQLILQNDDQSLYQQSVAFPKQIAQKNDNQKVEKVQALPVIQIEDQKIVNNIKENKSKRKNQQSMIITKKNIKKKQKNCNC